MSKAFQRTQASRPKVDQNEEESDDEDKEAIDVQPDKEDSGSLDPISQAVNQNACKFLQNPSRL